MALHLILTPQDWLFVAGTAFGVLLTNAVEFVFTIRARSRIARQSLDSSRLPRVEILRRIAERGHEIG